jgi:hypothetical protein
MVVYAYVLVIRHMDRGGKMERGKVGAKKRSGVNIKVPLLPFLHGDLHGDLHDRPI